MTTLFSRFYELYRAGLFEEAINDLDELSRQGIDNPVLLVWKERCLQLSMDPGLGELSQIEAFLKAALAVDDEYLPAIIDLAYFYSRVMSDERKATPLFRRALELCAKSATEAVVGLGECVEVIDSPQVAIEFLQKNRNLTLGEKQIDELIAEFKEY